MYDASHELQYLDMVFEETLRMYPPAPLYVASCYCVFSIMFVRVHACMCMLVHNVHMLVSVCACLCACSQFI